MSPCPFCEVPPDRIIMVSEGALAITDEYPLNPGHTLVVPRRHVRSLFELSVEEQLGLWRLVSQVRKHLSNKWKPDGFNIGLNDGRAAGQTIDHVHIHVIPRWLGDVSDPRGGIRWVLPERAVYWKD